MDPVVRGRIMVLSLVMVVVMMGFGMVIPIFPFYVERLGAGGSELGLLVALASLTEFIFAPAWGAVSDRAGRKPVLLVGLAGYLFSMILFGFADRLWMLFAIRGLSGVLSAAALSTSMAYVGDVTSNEDRASGMGIIGSAMGLGVIIGPGVGGVLGSGSLSTPFFASAAMTFAAFTMVFFMLPESLTGNRSAADAEIRLPLSGLLEALRGPVGMLFFLAFLLSFGLTNFESIFGLYFSGKYGYGPQEVGAILMVMGVVTTLGRGLLTGPLTRRWGEHSVIRGSLLMGSAGFLLLLRADTYPLILLATGFFIFSKTLLRPSILSLVSKNTGMGQGAALGLSNSFMSLGRIVGPLWAGYAFDVNTDYPYLSGAAILFLGALLSLAWRMRIPEKTGGAQGQALKLG